MLEGLGALYSTREARDLRHDRRHVEQQRHTNYPRMRAAIRITNYSDVNNNIPNGGSNETRIGFWARFQVSYVGTTGRSYYTGPLRTQVKACVNVRALECPSESVETPNPKDPKHKNCCDRCRLSEKIPAMLGGMPEVVACSSPKRFRSLRLN